MRVASVLEPPDAQVLLDAGVRAAVPGLTAGQRSTGEEREEVFGPFGRERDDRASERAQVPERHEVLDVVGTDDEEPVHAVQGVLHLGADTNVCRLDSADDLQSHVRQPVQRSEPDPHRSVRFPRVVAVGYLRG